ncbi:hypothetical protein C8Q76DRAFT_486234 [Earliella scabrosa]|nr:hypothetical protein C8Q76DRAFT_486234 [Earliella scabrosa]
MPSLPSAWAHALPESSLGIGRRRHDGAQVETTKLASDFSWPALSDVFPSTDRCPATPSSQRQSPASHFRAQKPQKAGGRHGLVVTPRASLDWQGNRPPLRGGRCDTPTSPPRNVPTTCITSRTDGVPSLLLDVAPHGRADGHCSFWCLPVASTGATADRGREAAHAAYLIATTVKESFRTSRLPSHPTARAHPRTLISQTQPHQLTSRVSPQALRTRHTRAQEEERPPLAQRALGSLPTPAPHSNARARRARCASAAMSTCRCQASADAMDARHGWRLALRRKVHVRTRAQACTYVDGLPSV